MEEENGGTEVVRIRSVRVLQRDSARFRPLSPLLSSPRLASPRHSTSRRNDAIALLRTLPTRD